ncbi:MAG: metallophosphoesterase family protein [Ignavibacteria bacterium]|nr:metallophosphoesterase family protein [Ignavibacteria bacterium]
MRAPYLQSLSQDSTLLVWVASDHGQPAVDYGVTLDYDRTVVASVEGDRRIATLTSLTPGTRYYYRVRAGDRVLAEGPQYSFETDAGPTDRSFNFFVTGDVGDKKGWQKFTAEAILEADPRPELGILCGDIVYSKGHSSDYDRRLMRPWKDLLCSIPVWPTLGDHDWKSPPEDNWEREWYLPNNEHYYSFDYANAHFIALDTRYGTLYDRANQIQWLEQDLSSNVDADWIFVYYHHPGITCTYKKRSGAVIENFLPLFDRYHVDVVFNGHAHTYERLYPIYDGAPVNEEQDPYYTDPEGTIYIISGAGGKYKEDKPTKYCGPTAFFRDEVLLWTQVFVEGPTCTIRTWESLSGDPVDEVVITKTTLAPSTSL